jgi:hypothetical protein
MKLSPLALSYRLKVRVLGNEFSTDSGYKERGGRVVLARVWANGSPPKRTLQWERTSLWRLVHRMIFR